jgi:predicted Zn-dependent protease with MMP-like domain
MSFDADDMEAYRNETYFDTLCNAVTIHELGHVLGFSDYMWEKLGYYAVSILGTCSYRGKMAN